MRKIIASVTLLMCLTGSASAMDMHGSGWDRFLEKNPLTQKVGWDQKHMDVQAASTGHLIARIKKLEAENEQLRNSISLIRAGKTSYGTVAPDPRIQGLIDENKRLMAQLDQRRTQQAVPSASYYLKQINILKEENLKLSDQVAELNIKVNKSSGPGGGIMDDTSVLKAYMEENQLLKEALNQRDNGAERIVALQQQIETLKEENNELKLSASLEEGDADDIFAGSEELARKDSEIAALKQKLTETQEENREMSLALVETTQKAFNSDKSADEAHEAYENNLKAVEVLTQRLTKAQEENRELSAKLELAKKDVASSDVSNEETEALRQQNESLRETIKAQSETLRSADNAAKTAERLLTENTTLQHKLELAQKSSSVTGKSAQELVKRIRALEKEVVKRDSYIKRMLAAKAEELAELSNSETPNAAGHIASLRDKNEALVEALDKEKDSNIAYRRKISEYQKEIERLNEVEQASSSGVHRAGIYERHVKALEQKQQQAENTVAVLKLENQELKARLELLVAQQTRQDKDLNRIQPATGERTGASSVGPNAKGYEKGVTFFDANYPSAEEPVLPLFDEDAEKKDNSENEANAAIDDKGRENMFDDRLAVNERAINPEALLATELTPLSESANR